MVKKIKLGKAGVMDKGLLICKKSPNSDAMVCKTCDGFDYYGKPQNERFIGPYTDITIRPNMELNLSPDKEGFIRIFGVPEECEEPKLVDDVPKGTKKLVCDSKKTTIPIERLTAINSITAIRTHYHSLEMDLEQYENKPDSYNYISHINSVKRFMKMTKDAYAELQDKTGDKTPLEIR